METKQALMSQHEELRVELKDELSGGLTGRPREPKHKSLIGGRRQAQLKTRLTRKLVRTNKIYRLLSEGDKVMVAVSGGKDSYTLLDLLHSARKKLPFNYEVVAVHLDQQQPGYDGVPLKVWLEQSGIPFEILSKDTYSIVKELTPPGGTYCAPCSRLRRGILYSTAERLGCNKIALGHHRDDALETLLMNMFYSGRIQSMPAMYRTDDGRFDVIRPLIECAEAEIAEYAQLRAFPILPCNLCGNQEGLKRVEMKKLLSDLELRNPGIRDVMLASMKHVRPSHLLDHELNDRLNGEGYVSTLEGSDPLNEIESGVSPSLIQIEG